MKPKIAPTSPKYQSSETVERLYAQQTQNLQQPSKRVSWTLIIVFTGVFGILAGAVGMVLLNSLYQQNPAWPFWRALRLDPGTEETREVVIRETGSVYQLDQERQEIYDRVSRSLVSVYQVQDNAYTYLGTGAFLTSDGVFAFDAGTEGVNTSANLHAFTLSGQELEVDFLDQDPYSELALGKVDGEAFPAMSFGVTADLRFGQSMYVFQADRTRGQAQMHVNEVAAAFAYTETASAVLRPSDTLSQRIQLNHNADAGGRGILVDHGGALQGIMLDEEASTTALPVTYIRTALQTYTTLGSIVRPMLGVHGYDLSVTLGLDGERTQDQKTGFLLAGTESQPAVISNGPAAQAGLQDGDILTAINGQTIQGSMSLERMLMGISIGTEATITFLRNGVEDSVQVIIRENAG